MNSIKLLELCRTIGSRPQSWVAVIAIVFIWFVAPHLHINGATPFASVGARFALLGITGGLVFLKSIMQFILQHRAASWQKFKTICQVCGTFLKNMFTGFRRGASYRAKQLQSDFRSRKDNYSLNKMPWYLIVGNKDTGKKTFLANSGLYFAKPEHFGDGAVQLTNQLPDVDWWFTEQCVLFDAMPVDQDSARQTWPKLSKVLKKSRRHRPINGMLLPISLRDLLTLSNKQRQNLLQDISFYIRQLHQQFSVQVPVYIIFTKCDLLEGFQDYFSDLSKSELDQIWGISFPDKSGQDSFQVKNQFLTEYQNIIDRLRHKILWSLDSERTQEGRERIFAFPQQMQLLKKPIETLLAELFTATRLQDALWIRGLYFTSCTQEGAAIDLVTQAFAKKFQLISPCPKRPQRVSDCYFAKQLFPQVILPEAKCMGQSNTYRRRKQLSKRLVQTALPIVAISTSVTIYQAYRYNKQQLNAVTQALSQFQVQQQNINSNSRHLSPLLPSLKTLQQTQQSLKANSHFGDGFLIAAHRLQHGLNHALHRELNSEMLPRVAAQLEKRLEDNMTDQNRLYITLKAYLAFQKQTQSANLVLPAMNALWQEDKVGSTTHQLYKQFLTAALQQPITPLPLNSDLLNRRRNELADIVPAKRAYGLLELEAAASQIQPINLRTLAGQDFSNVFVSNTHLSSIPGLYTEKGYQQLFLAHAPTVAKAVAEDNWLIGISQHPGQQSVAEITADMDSHYAETYKTVWQQHLKALHIKPFNSAQDATRTLNRILATDSPVNRLLSTIYDNSHALNNSKANIEKDFTDINHYTTHTGSGDNWQNTVKSLTALRDYLLKLQQAPESDVAMFKAAQSVMQAKANPIVDLLKQADNSPEPVRSWLRQIAMQSWQVINKGAMTKIDSDWQQQVLPYYHNELYAHFPIKAYSPSTVMLAHFNRFFAEDGIADKFFKQNLSMFIDTEKQPWHLISIHGLRLGLSASDLKTLERIQAIRNDYFADNPKSAQLAITMTPERLDANAADVSLVVGDQSVSYAHGPQITKTINWPNKDSSEGVSVEIHDFQGNSHRLAYSGPWAIFKLLHNGRLTQSSDSGNYKFQVTIDDMHASFVINASADKNRLLLTHMVGLQLPTHLRNRG